MIVVIAAPHCFLGSRWCGGGHRLATSAAEVDAAGCILSR